jgi:phosphoglycolate phosphatase-like HAD superfamily hydrolase
MIECFGLEPVAQAARECMEFSGLFSKTRGANRHKTLKRILSDLLPGHPMVKSRGFAVPQLPHYFAWVDDPNSVLSGDGLRKAIAGTKGPAKKELELALAWHEKVSRTVAQVVRDVPPFPFVRECLQRMQKKADVIVVSTSPCEALMREWSAQDLVKCVDVIAGQEMGAKARSLEAAAKGRYNENHVLMIGDAPGDLKAARANNALFYPIDPGEEEASWKRLHDEAMDKFFDGTYAGRYESELVEEFDSRLPERPSWVTRS